MTRRGLVAAAIGASIIASVSCRGSGRSFGALLAKIDAARGLASEATFLGAASLARGTEDRLRLLKRASALEPDRYADVAAAVLKAGSVSEPVALAALDAYILSGRYEAALSLFEGPLDPSSRSAEYAESLVLAARSGANPAPPYERLVATADLTGDWRFMARAAIDAMVEGDRAVALTLLADAERFEGAALPYRLLWDAGAVGALSERTADPGDPLEIAVIADAERLSGDEAAACASYAYLIARFPSWSWKPYAALARLGAGTAPSAAAPEWPHAPRMDAQAGSGPPDTAGRLYATMAERFPGSREASIERARWLYSQGRVRDASSLVSGLQGEEAAIASLDFSRREKSVPDALRLAALYPDSPIAIDSALAALAGAGAWERFGELAMRSDGAGLSTRRAWFWRALTYAISGDATLAADEIRRYGPAAAGFPGAFDLGILEMAARRPDRAADAFVIAAGLAREADERSEAFIRAGDALASLRRYDQAYAAYESALGADPASREARSRLERIKDSL